MLRPLTLVPVRQQQREPAGLAPLLLAGHDELVHDDLAHVDEVAELRLPAHQGVLGHHRLAVLEAQRGELVQRRIVDQERALVVRQVRQRVPPALGPVVDQHGMPLAERPPA